MHRNMDSWGFLALSIVFQWHYDTELQALWIVHRLQYKSQSTCEQDCDLRVYHR